MQYENLFREMIIGMGVTGLILYSLIVIYTVILVKIVCLFSDMIFRQEKVTNLQFVLFVFFVLISAIAFITSYYIGF